jgi:hypothetical protein
MCQRIAYFFNKRGMIAKYLFITHPKIVMMRTGAIRVMFDGTAVNFVLEFAKQMTEAHMVTN